MGPPTTAQLSGFARRARPPRPRRGCSVPVLRRRTRAEFSLLSQLTGPFAPEVLTHTARSLLDISTSLGKTGTTSSASIKITR
jgi:hypothetical protein